MGKNIFVSSPTSFVINPVCNSVPNKVEDASNFYQNQNDCRELCFKNQDTKVSYGRNESLEMSTIGIKLRKMEKLLYQIDKQRSHQ